MHINKRRILMHEHGSDEFLFRAARRALAPKLQAFKTPVETATDEEHALHVILESPTDIWLVLTNIGPRNLTSGKRFIDSIRDQSPAIRAYIVLWLANDGQRGFDISALRADGAIWAVEPLNEPLLREFDNYIKFGQRFL